MINKKINNILYMILSIIFIVIVGFLFNLSIFNTSAITIDPITEYTYYLKDNVLKNILIIIVILGILFVVNRNKKFKSIINEFNNNKILFNRIKKVLIIIIFALCIVFVLSGRFFAEADQYSVQLISGEILKGNFISMNPGEYLDRYPFQSGLVLISLLFSLIFGMDNYIVLGIVNSALIALFYKELTDIFDELGFSNTTKLCVLLSSFFFPVLIFYSYFIYGTIPGITLGLIAFKYEIKYFKEENRKDMIISLVTILFSQFFKTNYVIFAIAMIIYALLKTLEVKDTKKLIFSGLLCLTILIQSFLPIFIMEGISGKKIDNGISSYAYVAMSMQDSERAPGWYNGYNNDSYFTANFDSEKQKELAIDEIKERVAFFNNNKDLAMQFYGKKISSLWNNPTFQSFWNLQRKIPKKEVDTRPGWLLWLVDKKGSYTISRYLDIVMTVIYFGALLYGFSLLNENNKRDLAFFSIFFIGGFIFHLFWEGKAQYTFVYFILLIPLAIAGYNNIIANINDIKIKPLAIVSCVLVLLISVMFVTNKFDFLNKDNEDYYNYIYYTIDNNKYGGD